MRIADQAVWQQQQAEIAQRPTEEERQAGEAFLKFLQEWCDRAEEYLTVEGPHAGHHPRSVDALRKTLQPTEADLGVLPPQWTAQLLLVISACWEYGGSDLFEEMTVFEKKMVADMAALVNAKAQEGADDVASTHS